MRGLASRSVRPSIGQRHLLHTSTPVRRSFLPPHRRRFTAADAFSILLAPVLTTAFVADTTAKQDKKKEWDRQIAAVQQESEQLKERQLVAWSRRQRRSVSNGAWQQRRMYSAAAEAVKVEDDMDDPLDYDVVDQDPEQDEQRMGLDEGVAKDDIDAVQRFDRLIATRMALQLLLQLKSGDRTVYTMPIETEPTLFAAKHHSLEYLLKELGKVGKMLHNLYRQRLPYGPVHPPEYLERREKLSTELTELTNRYRQSETHLPEFVMAYINTISKHRMGPPVSNYVDIMRVFQKMGIMPMAVIAENAVWESQQYLNNKAVSSILFCHGTEMDAYRLKEFLKRVVRADLFPRPEKKWAEMHIDDMRLAVPKSKNPWVLACLIRASLCCQQFSIAEAYAKEFCRRDSHLNYEGKFKSWIVTTFIHTYTRVASWQAGLTWINHAIDWMADMLEEGQHYFGRVILRILEHCVVCGQREAYHSLLQACIASGLPLPPIDESRPHLFSKRVSEIRKDWASQLHPHHRGHIERALPQEQLVAFQQSLRDIFRIKSRIPKPEAEFTLVVGREDNLRQPEYSPQFGAERSKTFTQSPASRYGLVTPFVQASESSHQPQVENSVLHSPLPIPLDEAESRPALNSQAIVQSNAQDAQSASDSETTTSILDQLHIPTYADFWPQMEVSEHITSSEEYRPHSARDQKLSLPETLQDSARIDGNSQAGPPSVKGQRRNDRHGPFEPRTRDNSLNDEKPRGYIRFVAG